MSMSVRADIKAGATEATWGAAWIWHPGDRWAVDVHLLARKEFDLPAGATHATLRIAAHTDYKLFVNGAYVARGPLPGDPHRYASYDSHDITRLLHKGRNVVAVVCHNYGIGLHWHHRAPGALIAQLDIETARGRISVSTDGTWRMTRASGYGASSPRMFWAAGFMETYDFTRVDDRWLAPAFDDGEWQRPEVLTDDLTRPRVALATRDIPLLREADEPPVGVERGTFTLANVHAVRFDAVLAPDQAGLVYAYTDLHAEQQQEVVLQLECDDACKVFVNGRLAIEQNYSEGYARTRVWRGKDDYEQLHDGMGDTGFTATVTLQPGPNSLLAAVDHGPRGWGFVLTALDPASGRPLGLAFTSESDRRDGGHDEGRWTVVGPFPSSGMNDSLDDVAADPAALVALAAGSTAGSAAARSLLCDPFDYTGVTDYATLMAREERQPGDPVALGEPIGLRPGAYCIVDLGLVRAGYPTLTLRSSGEAIVDIGYSQTLAADRAIRYSNGGRMKYVDRVYLRDGEQTWQPLQRRTGRYIHLSCRAGDAVMLMEAAMRTVGYPVDDVATFECADPTLNRIWEVSRYTTQLLMQYGYQDCLKREEGTLNFNSFNYAARAAAQCFGDHALARRALRVALGTQNESGWFQGQGVSGLNSDEPTEMLWAAVFLHDQYLYSGDDGFLRQSFEGIEEALRYHAKAINRHGLLDGGNWPVFRQGQGVYLDDVQLSGPYLGFFPGELAGDNILYAAALGSAAALATALGLEERAAFYTRKAARVRRALNRRLWDPRARRYADWRRGDERAATGHPIFTIAALYFELPDEGQAGDALRFLLDEVGLPDEDNAAYPLGTFGFYYYLLEVLFRYGRDDLAYELLRRYYGRWLELGATTFGEHFALSDYKGQAALDREYEVHGYGTSAHLHFYSNILGLRPAAPGFARVEVAPHPGDLPWARGEVATPRGPIRVSWQTQGDTFTLEVEAPEGVDCEVRAPGDFARHDLRVNGERRDAL